MLVFLVGFMGAGKSTLGKKLAIKLSLPFVDLDKEVAQQYNFQSVASLIDQKGMAYFRQIEKEVLQAMGNRDAVVSTGGGTPCFFDNIDWMLRKGEVVYLKVEEGVLFSRLKASDVNSRPLLRGMSDDELKMFIHETMQERTPYYNRAHIVFNPIIQKVEELTDILDTHKENKKAHTDSDVKLP